MFRPGITEGVLGRKLLNMEVNFNRTQIKNMGLGRTMRVYRRRRVREEAYSMFHNKKTSESLNTL